MGKASSNKKVARAARAGGGRARAAGERNFLFPAALALVVVLGMVLVVYARDQRMAEAVESPQVGDHWHSAYGFYTCDSFEPSLPEFVAPQNGGNHTHGDGLVHIHPFATSRAGENATLGNWMADAGAVLGSGGDLSADTLGIPGGETYIEGEDSCEGVEGDPIVQVAVWDVAQNALDGDDPTRVVTEGFGDIRFEDDGQVFTIAFAPEGADIPPPESLAGLADTNSDLGVPADEVPDEVPGGAGQPTDSPEATAPTDTGEGDGATGDPTTAPEADGGS
ncbi:MAG: hypothetical protein U5K30_09315 [Acidimicrobiales bacterium]|nr:hypothetical protein [Acidimicrobiales bacterium]